MLPLENWGKQNTWVLCLLYKLNVESEYLKKRRGVRDPKAEAAAKTNNWNKDRTSTIDSKYRKE